MLRSSSTMRIFSAIGLIVAVGRDGGSVTDRERLAGRRPVRPLAGAEAAAERPVGLQPGVVLGGALDVAATDRGGGGRRAPGGGDLDRPRGRRLVGHAPAGVVDEVVLRPPVVPAAHAEVTAAVVAAVADRDRALADGAVGNARAPLLQLAGAVDGGDLPTTRPAVAVRVEPDGSGRCGRGHRGGERQQQCDQGDPTLHVIDYRNLVYELQCSDVRSL